jgi:hypothetical protein
MPDRLIRAGFLASLTRDGFRHGLRTTRKDPTSDIRSMIVGFDELRMHRRRVRGVRGGGGKSVWFGRKLKEFRHVTLPHAMKWEKKIESEGRRVSDETRSQPVKNVLGLTFVKVPQSSFFSLPRPDDISPSDFLLLLDLDALVLLFLHFTSPALLDWIVEKNMATFDA